MDLPTLYGMSSLLDRLMDQDENVAVPTPHGVGAGHFPPVQIIETGDALLIRACLPGVSLDDLTAKIKRNSLVIEGTIPRPEGRSVRQERHSGPFRREVPLPVQVEKNGSVDVTLADGLLTVALPKVSGGD